MGDNLKYSTLTKPQNVNKNGTQSQNLDKTVGIMKDFMSKSNVMSYILKNKEKPLVETEELRKKLLVSDVQDWTLTLCKKSKKMGSNVVRDIKIKDDLTGITQQKGKKTGKNYNVPIKFVPQTKAEYLAESQSLSKDEKKKFLDWNAKKVAKAQYRIMFNRFDPDGNPNAAFYFEKEEEFEKMKNYLKGIQLLEAKGMNQKLEQLGMNFRATICEKVKEYVHERAEEKRREILKKRAAVLEQSEDTTNMTKAVVGSIIAKWKYEAGLSADEKNDKDKRKRDRLERLKQAVKQSSINNINKKLTNALVYAWREEAEDRIQPNKEEILIEFNTLEISSEVIQPSIRVEAIFSKAYPVTPYINDSNNREFTISCQLEGPKSMDIYDPKNRQVYDAQNKDIFDPKYLGIYDPRDIDLYDIKNVEAYDFKHMSFYDPKKIDVYRWSMSLRDNMGDPNRNATTAGCSIQFNDFLKDYINDTHIKISLYDESDNVIAYHYTPLKDLYNYSKKGGNMWLSMTPRQQDSKQFPLLHLGCKSFLKEKIHKLPSMYTDEIKLYDLNIIEDSFYDYKITIPNITPKEAKFFELFPSSWELYDQACRSFFLTRDYSSFIKRIKYNLLQHYQVKTSRQVARLKQGAYAWVDLQDMLAGYAPRKDKEEDQSYIWADENAINKMIKEKTGIIIGREDLNDDNNDENGQNGEGNNGASATKSQFSGIASYLFKRDRWESKDQWKQFFLKLKRLIMKGIPSQSRIQMWSELGRTIYFVKVTYSRFKEYLALTNYKRMNLIQGDYSGEDGFNDSKKVYDMLIDHIQNDPENRSLNLYQELEDDLVQLAARLSRAKIPYEKEIRRICRCFIFWSRLFSQSETKEEIRYRVTYSRSVLNLCYGLVICQACNYLEEETTIYEDQIFWLLISLTTFILSSYFELNEKELSVDQMTLKEAEHRRRNPIVDSTLRNVNMRGIRSDCVLLRLLLKHNNPDILDKFDELGLPLEFFFVDHMTTLFLNMFNPGLTYRIWDCLFFEGSSNNQVKCNRLIVCILYKLIVDCKGMILKAKKPQDIQLIIDIYGKFQTEYGRFLKYSYKICDKYFEQEVPSQTTVFGKIKFIGHTLFSSEYDKYDKKIRQFSDMMKEHHKVTEEQNIELYNLVNKKFKLQEDGPEQALSYDTLTKMVKEFNSKFGVEYKDFRRTVTLNRDDGDYVKDEFEDVDPVMRHSTNLGRKTVTEMDINIAPDRFMRKKLASINFKVHRLTMYWPELDQLSVVITYGGKPVKYPSIQSLMINYENEFPVNANKKIPRKLLIEVFDNKDRAEPVRVKYAEIDLKTIPVNNLTKLVFRLNDDNMFLQNLNHINAEIELSILLIAAKDKHDPSKLHKWTDGFYIPELENGSYRKFRNFDLYNLYKNTEDDEVYDLEKDVKTTRRTTLPNDPLTQNAYKYTFLAKERNAWKSNYEIEYNEFTEIMSNLAPYWEGIADYKKIFNAISTANRNGVFYICDFFILLIIFGKYTLNQKLSLMFELLGGFDDRFGDPQPEVPYYVVKGLASYLYELFMIYMPFNEIENLVDLHVYGNTPAIKKVIINDQTDRKIVYPRKYLNRLANFIHLNFHKKEIPLHNQQLLNYLRATFEKEDLDAEGRFISKDNIVDITYFTNGMTHKIRLKMDQNWKIKDDVGDHLNLNKPVSTLLHKFKNVISLNNNPKMFRRYDFINCFQQLPLLNYLFSYETVEMLPTLPSVEEKNINYLFAVDGEYVWQGESADVKHVENPFTSNKKGSNDKKEPFMMIDREWNDLLLSVGIKGAARAPLGYQRQGTLRRQSTGLLPHVKMPRNKLDMFLPYRKIATRIKKSIMRHATEALRESAQNISIIPWQLLNDHLYLQDFFVNIRINEVFTIEVPVIDDQLSPFNTIEDIAQGFVDQHGTEITKIDIIFNLTRGTYVETSKAQYNQIARYRFSDNSTQWLPCSAEFKFRFDDYNFEVRTKDVEGFGVRFQDYPSDVIYKKNKDFGLVYREDVEELELKNTMRQSYRQSFRPSYRQGILDSPIKDIGDRFAYKPRTMQDDHFNLSPIGTPKKYPTAMPSLNPSRVVSDRPQQFPAQDPSENRVPTQQNEPEPQNNAVQNLVQNPVIQSKVEDYMTSGTLWTRHQQQKQDDQFRSSIKPKPAN